MMLSHSAASKAPKIEKQMVEYATIVSKEGMVIPDFLGVEIARL
jgi:hypothetical protein